MLSIVTGATVRTGAALHGHWCMGRSFMRPGVWSIDSLTSALREAFDGLETRARVPAVIHTCYQSVKKEKKGVSCRTSLNESHQGRWGKSRWRWKWRSWCCGHGWLKVWLHEACSTPFSSTKHRDVLHNGHRLYISCLSSWKGFRPHSAWSHCWVLQSFGATMTSPIKWFKSLYDMFTFIHCICMYVCMYTFTSYCWWKLSTIYGWFFVGK